jgi:hypothetical protein
LSQWSNKSTLLSPAEKSNIMDTKIEDKREERRKLLENIILEVIATLFVGSLVVFCFWFLLRS